MAATPQVRWTAKGQNGEVAAWAGDGSGIVTLFDEQRPGFGDVAPDYRGPACLVRFAVDREERGAQLHFEAWIPINDLDQQEAA